MAATDIKYEVIEFVQPLEDEKNLLITNISAEFEDETAVQEVLTEKLGRYGLLYEVQVKSYTDVEELAEKCGDNNVDTEQGGFYAFVKFYSSRATSKAHRDLASRFYLKGRHVRVRFANRKKEVDRSYNLYVVKCYDLANYYLGFNGWSTKIVSMVLDAQVSEPSLMRYFCVLKLTLHNHHVTTEGVGVGEKTYELTNPCTKLTAVCVARKRAHQRAVEAAFARIVLVVLPDGRVYADVNSTVEDSLEEMNMLNTEGVVQVNELEDEPEVGEGEEDFPVAEENSLDQDLLNQQILAELELEEDDPY